MCLEKASEITAVADGLEKKKQYLDHLKADPVSVCKERLTTKGSNILKSINDTLMCNILNLKEKSAALLENLDPEKTGRPDFSWAPGV